MNKWTILAIVAIGTFMTTLDGSIVNISLPAIADNFHAPLNGLVEWVIIAYLVVIAALLLTFGRLADMIGRKPIWLGGLAIFTTGSALCGLAPSLLLLIVERAFQGIGAALLYAPSIALLTDAFPREERGRAIGINAVVVSLGVSAGPTLGGFITQYLTWRWIFFINVPIGLVGFILSWRVLRGTPRRDEPFDPVGATLLGLGLAGVTLGLSFGQEWGWTSPLFLASAGIGVGALVASILVERRMSSPVINLDLFTDRLFASAMASLVLNFLAFFAVFFLLPFYLENLRNYPAHIAGLLLTPFSLVVALLAPISGSLADRIGSRWLAAGGLAVASVGLVFLSTLDAQTSVLGLIWRLSFVGAGVACFQSPNNRSIMAAAPAELQGEASGLLATGRVVGQSLSVAVVGAVFSLLGGSAAEGALASHHLAGAQLAHAEATFVQALHVSLLVCAALAAVGAAASLVRGTADRSA